MTTRRAAKEPAEFETEETFHRREWRVQRVGWALLFILIVCACLGLLGHGPLAPQTSATNGGALEFDRFVRREASTEWIIRPASHIGTDETFVVHISSALLQRYEISAIDPEPIATGLAGPNAVFRFGVTDPRGSIVFHVKPQHAGVSTGAMQLGDSESVEVKQVVYP